jgi:transposase InsO family protein
VILELSGEFPVKLLCLLMEIQRSSFYNWKKHLSQPAQRSRNLVSNILLFQEYHLKYPSHGYRWLNAKIRLDTGLVLSDPYAHRCCKAAGIKSMTKHYRYKKPGEPGRMYPNLLLSEMQVNEPLQCIVSDMTAFYVKGIYYELTLYMDLWNNEIVSHALSSKRGDRMTYMSGLDDVLKLKAQYPEYKMVLHSDQGAVYSSKAFNELLPMYNIQRSMSRAGTPTDNAAMEAINGWIKAELFVDLHVTPDGDTVQEVANYIHFFNQQRPAYSLNYMTPIQFKESYCKVTGEQSFVPVRT